MPWEMAANAAKIGLGVAQARSILREFKPQAVLSTGGYASFPVAVAARAAGIPLAVYLPDLYPGWAVRATAQLAQRVAVTAVESLRRLPAAKSVVTGYPVREEFWQANRAQRDASDWGWTREEKVLFVFGASQGAHSINRAIASELNALLQLCEVVHLSGRADEPWLGGDSRRAARTSCAGATTCTDTCMRRCPGRWPRPTWPSAVPALRRWASFPPSGCRRYLCPTHTPAGTSGSTPATWSGTAPPPSWMTKTSTRCCRSSASLLHDEQRLRSMREAARRLARPEAARRIAGMIVELAGARAA